MFCAQRQFERRIRRKTRRISRIVFLLFANHCLKLRNKKFIEDARRQISGSSNHIAPSGPTSWIVQSDRSVRTNKSDHPIRSLWQDQQVGSSNQIAPSGPTSRIVQSDRSFRTNKSDRPIRSLLQYQQVRSSNQIAPSGPTSWVSQSERSIRTYFRTSQSEHSIWTYFTYRPIRSLLRT